MPKAKRDGETRVQEYLTGAGFRVKGFSRAEMRRGRTPDLRVWAGDDLGFYCEVKTAQEDEWLGSVRRDPTYNRISKYIHSAVGQFDAVNPRMEHPNVLAIVNGDADAGFMDLIQVLTGNAYCESGEMWPMYRKYSEGRIREEKLRVHLYLWFNEWKAGDPQKFFPEVHAEHHAALCRHFSADPAVLRRLPTT